MQAKESDPVSILCSLDKILKTIHKNNRSLLDKFPRADTAHEATYIGVNDRYLLGETIGMGGAGEIHVGFDRKRRSTVAIKTTRTTPINTGLSYTPTYNTINDVGSLENEAVLQAFHAARGASAVPEVYDYIREGDREYIVMQYFSEDESWSNMTNLEFNLDNRLLLAKILENLATALTEIMHVSVSEMKERGRNRKVPFHFDIKPSNLMVNKDGEVRIIDFGLVGTSVDTPNILGTPLYIAPETIIDSDLFRNLSAWVKPKLSGTDSEKIEFERLQQQALQRERYSLASLVYEFITGEFLTSYTRNGAPVTAANEIMIEKVSNYKITPDQEAILAQSLRDLRINNNEKINTIIQRFRNYTDDAERRTHTFEEFVAPIVEAIRHN